MPLDPDPEIVIRPYNVADRAAVREISCLTAMLGEPSAAFFDDDEIFADALTLYFTDHEPASCFVAVCDNRVIGYLLGAMDATRMEKVTGQKIGLPLLVKALRRGTLLHKKNLEFIFNVFLSLVKGEFKAPSFVQDYPAALHINIIGEYRSLGIGSKLMAAYLDHLKQAGVKGVHFATMSEGAGQFYTKLDFQLLFHGTRSYFRYFLGKDVLFNIYGMRFPAKGATRG